MPDRAGGSPLLNPRGGAKNYRTSLESILHCIVNLRDLMLVVKRRLAVDFARAKEQLNARLTHHG